MGGVFAPFAKTGRANSMPQFSISQAINSRPPTPQGAIANISVPPGVLQQPVMEPSSLPAPVGKFAGTTIRLLYLDDSDIDHRLLSAYLRMDNIRDYSITPCMTLEAALFALKSEQYDALIIDNRVPPFDNYHEPYKHLKQGTGYRGPTLIISADISGKEFSGEQRQDRELVLDKADLLPAVKAGFLAQVAEGLVPHSAHSGTFTFCS